jgi:hypothetical protein
MMGAVGAAWATVSVACTDIPLNSAVIVTVWLELTEPAETVKLADVASAGIVTEDGTETAAELEERVTVTPAGGAGIERKTVP